MLWGISKIFTDPSWVQSIGSLLAVAVALGLALEQRLSSERSKHEERERDHRADRSNLNFALSQLRNYCSRCVRKLALIMENSPSVVEIHIPNDWGKPEIDPAGVRDIAKCISTSPTTGHARAFGRLLEALQVQQARLDRLDEKRGQQLSSYEVAGYLYDAATLAAQVDAFFDYARFRSERIDQSLTADRIATVVRIEGIERVSPNFEPFFFIVDQRHSPI